MKHRKATWPECHGWHTWNRQYMLDLAFMIPPLAKIYTTMHKAQKGAAIYKVQMPLKVFTWWSPKIVEWPADFLTALKRLIAKHEEPDRASQCSIPKPMMHEWHTLAGNKQRPWTDMIKGPMPASSKGQSKGSIKGKEQRGSRKQIKQITYKGQRPSKGTWKGNQFHGHGNQGKATAKLLTTWRPRKSAKASDAAKKAGRTRFRRRRGSKQSGIASHNCHRQVRNGDGKVYSEMARHGTTDAFLQD